MRTVSVILVVTLAALCVHHGACKKKKKHTVEASISSEEKRPVKNGWVELSEFDKTLDGKVMPTGKGHGASCPKVRPNLGL